MKYFNFSSVNFYNRLCNFIPTSDIPYQAVAGRNNKFQRDKLEDLTWEVLKESEMYNTVWMQHLVSLRE
jgi:hypothetical protein